MRRSTLHRLLQKCVALVAIAVMGGVPMLSACTCGLAIPQAVVEAAVETEECCSDCCTTSATESIEIAGSECCGTTSGAPSNCDDCGGCCLDVKTAPSLLSTPLVQDNGQSSPLAHPAILPNAFHSGLNGVAWHNAFDLSSPGGPPGVRLHALLSVWRN